MRKILKKFLDNRKALPYAFLAVLLLTAPLALNVVFNTSRLQQIKTLASQSNHVLLELESLSFSVQEARSLHLQYLADTQQETRKQDLQQFRTAADEIGARTDLVAFLMHDNPGQQQRISRFRRLAEEDLDTMRSVQRSNSTSAGFGTPHTEEVRQLLLEIKEQQQLLLQAQSDTAAKYATETWSSITVCIAVFSLVVAILFLLIMQGMTEQRRSQQIASSARTELESSLVRLEKETESITLFNELQQNFQICYTAAEAHEIITTYLTRLFPGANGSLATINNSRNIMETMVSWGEDTNVKGQAFAPEDCCALRGGRMYSYTRDQQGLACHHFNGEVPDAYVCLPLVALGETLGILHLNSPDANVISLSRLRPLQQVVEQAAMTLANLNLRAKLQEQSIRDPLTGLFNRRYLEITLERDVRRSARKHSGVGIIMADGDKFKLFNDTFGHEAGDVVLKEIAGVLRRSVRSEDVVCRYGGEEFIIVLTDCTVSTVCDRAEVMRNSISKLQLEHAGRSLGKVTASFGASFCQDGSVPPETLVRLADEALYKAKKEGRDRVVLSNSIQEPAAQPEKPLAPAASVLTN